MPALGVKRHAGSARTRHQTTKYQSCDLDGFCPVPWFRTALSKFSRGVRCLCGIIPSQVSAMFSQFRSSFELSALFAIRRQWSALARYLSALPMAILLSVTHPVWRNEASCTVMGVTECLAGSIASWPCELLSFRQVFMKILTDLLRINRETQSSVVPLFIGQWPFTV